MLYGNDISGMIEWLSLKKVIYITNPEPYTISKACYCPNLKIHFETRLIATFVDGIKFRVHYVHNVFCIVKKDRIVSLLDHLYRQSNRISFTHERRPNQQTTSFKCQKHKM